MSEQNSDLERQAYTPAELARAVGRNPATIYRAIYRGEIRVLDYGGRLMIPVSEFTRFFSKITPYTPRKGTGRGRKRKGTKQTAEAAQ